MKFFKYLILTSLSFLSFNALADYKLAQLSNSPTFPTQQAACDYFRSQYAGADSHQLTNNGNTCTLYRLGSGLVSSSIVEVTSQCSAQYIYSKPINVPGWTNWNVDQITAYSNKIQGQTACYKGCKYKNPSMTGDTTSDSMKLMFGDGVKDSSCPETATEAPDTPYPDNVTPPTDGCKNGEAYCDKPTTGCPSGYTSGSFNGKQICVKNNPDPTKPNPNDPNNNPNNSKFDDSKIIAAINDSKNAITNSINNAVNSINNSISSINQSITTVANAVNGTTNAVNNNTSAVNAVKSSVDALHNTINAVTTAVNNNTTAVTSAVNANTSATNAVKASVDALNGAVSTVTSAVDNNTKAVNANGDKVANAVKDNITATNAVKTAVENLNTAVNAVTTAVNANGDKVSNSVNTNGDKVVNAVNSNGDKVTDAVNKGTEATKENGKKLDGVKSSVDEGNGLLKDIKDWLTGEPELETGELEIKEEILPGYERKNYVQFTNTCPFTSEQVSLPMGVLGSMTFTKDLTFICSYGADARPYIIGLGYLGALIYLLYGLRSRNG